MSHFTVGDEKSMDNLPRYSTVNPQAVQAALQEPPTVAKEQSSSEDEEFI